MKKKRPVKKKPTPSHLKSSTQPPAGRVIRSSEDLSTANRKRSATSGQGGKKKTTPPSNQKRKKPVKSKPKKISRRAKRRWRMFLQTCVFLGVTLTLLVVSYDFVEGYFEERTKQQELLAEQIIPIHEIQLELSEEILFKFFIEKDDQEEESQLITVKFPKNQVTLKKRTSIPYPYLKANCPKENRYCKLEEASDVTLYLTGDDIQEIQIP